MNWDLFFEQKDLSIKWISRGIIVFWAFWSLLVALSDSVNFLQQANILPSHWVFTSKNYDLVMNSLALYQINNVVLTLFLYFFIVLFAWIITLCFIRAAFSSSTGVARYLQRCYTAFLLSFAIEAFFIMADEIFVQYALEHGHMDRLGFKMLTFLVFFVLEQKAVSVTDQ